MNVKVKKMHPDAAIPQYAKPGDSGFDLAALEDVIVSPGETVKVKTGLAFEITEGFELQIRPRSGISTKTTLRVVSGTVDSGYRGEVSVTVDNIKSRNHYRPFSLELIDGSAIETDQPYMYRTYLIRKGDRIAQGVIAPVVQVEFIESDELSNTERGTCGFGSTGTSI